MNNLIADNTDMFFVTVIFLLLVLLVMQAFRSRKNRNIFGKRIQFLEENVQALCAGAMGIDTALNNINRRIDRLAQRQETAGPRVDTGARGYNSAIRMIKRGATVGDLVEKCGITSAEAKLLYSMHAGGDNEKASPATARRVFQ